MSEEMVYVLITKGRKGRLLRMKSSELARLKQDFAGFKNSNRPEGGTYAHYLHVPTSVEPAGSGWFPWRRVKGMALRRKKIALEFKDVTGITGA